MKVKEVEGKLLTSLDDLMDDEMPEWECPECRNATILDAEASSFNCECGAVVITQDLSSGLYEFSMKGEGNRGA